MWFLPSYPETLCCDFQLQLFISTRQFTLFSEIPATIHTNLCHSFANTDIKLQLDFKRQRRLDLAESEGVQADTLTGRMARPRILSGAFLPVLELTLSALSLYLLVPQSFIVHQNVSMTFIEAAQLGYAVASYVGQTYPANPGFRGETMMEVLSWMWNYRHSSHEKFFSDLIVHKDRDEMPSLTVPGSMPDACEKFGRWKEYMERVIKRFESVPHHIGSGVYEGSDS